MSEVVGTLIPSLDTSLGLCLPDDPTRAKQLLIVGEEEEEESEDVKVAKEALSEV